MRLRTFQVACISFLGMLVGLVSAQLPYVPPELHQEQRRLRGDQVGFCIWSSSPTAAFDQAVAEELAAALLLEPTFYTYEQTTELTGEDLWETLFILLAEHCDAMMGFKLTTGVYPEWLITSRPYYQAPYTLAVTNEIYNRLSDIPRDKIIGSRVFSEADYQFLGYLQSLSEDQRWRRFPYTDDEMLLEHLEGGTIEGAILWAPALIKLTGGDPAARGVRMIGLDPISSAESQVGIVMREYNTFLRTALDEAIVALTEDGVIEQLLDEFDLPGRQGEL